MWLHAQQGRLQYVSGLLHKAASGVRRTLYRSRPGKWKWQPRLFVVDLTGDTPQLRYKGHYEPPRNAWPHEPWEAADKALADLGTLASTDVAANSGAQPALLASWTRVTAAATCLVSGCRCGRRARAGQAGAGSIFALTAPPSVRCGCTSYWSFHVHAAAA